MTESEKADIVERLRGAAKLPKEFMVDVALNAAADEIERLRAERADWVEVFTAQKSVIEMLIGTLREIKRHDRDYNFGSKLNRIVDGALNRLPGALREASDG